MIRHGAPAISAGAFGARTSRQVARASADNWDEVLNRERGHHRRCAGIGDDRAHVVLAAVVGREVGAEHGRLGGVVDGAAEERGQQRTQEQDRAYQARDRVSGQAEHAGVADPAEHQRLARPHGDPPEIKRHALGLERLADHGRGRRPRRRRASPARRRASSWRRRRRCRSPRRRRRRCRGRGARRRGWRRRRRCPARSMRRSDRGRGWSPGATSSSPVEMMATPRLAAHRDGAVPTAPASAISRMPRRRPAASSRSPSVKSRPAGRMLRPAATASRAVRCRRVGLGVLLDQHRVGAFRHRRAGEDADRLAGSDDAVISGAGGGHADHPELRRRAPATSAARTA